MASTNNRDKPRYLLTSQAERETFERGYTYGVEWMIEAHDPLLRLCALYSARASAPAEVDAFVVETMEAVRRVREDQAQALDFYRRERDQSA